MRVIMKFIFASFIGSCFYHDIFNLNIGKKYVNNSYVKKYNPFLILQTLEPKYHFIDQDISLLNSTFAIIFNRRLILFSVNRNAKKLLLSKKGNWIIINIYYLYGIYFRILYLKLISDLLKEMFKFSGGVSDCN